MSKVVTGEQVIFFQSLDDLINMKPGSLKTKYRGHCILRPPVQPEQYGLKLKVVLKWRGIYIENVKVVPVMANLETEVIVKWRGLKSLGTLYYFPASLFLCHEYKLMFEVSFSEIM